MLTIRYEKKFRKDIKLIKKRGYDLNKLEAVLRLLVAQTPLPEQYHDHALSGNYSGHRECHISPDWLLIYKVIDDQLILTLTRTGTHIDVFPSKF